MDFTEKEAEIYDRQIRLWGVEAQQRLRSARVYICGLSGVGAEVCKNLVLAGISVTLLDSVLVTAAHLGANFLLEGEGCIGKNVGALPVRCAQAARQTACTATLRSRHAPPHSTPPSLLQRALSSQAKAQELNQLVRVSALGVGLEGLSDAELLSGSAAAPSSASPAPASSHPLVIVCDQSPAALVAACARCRALAIPLLAGSTHGFHALAFQDSGPARAYLHTPPPARDGSQPPPEQRTAHFHSLADILAARAAAAHAALAATKQPQPTVHAWLALHALAAAGAPSCSSAEQLQAELREVLPAAGCSAAAVQAAVEACSSLLAGCCGATELSPVAAVAGAMVANEAMKAVTGKDAPMCSVLCFDGMGGSGGRVYKL